MAGDLATGEVLLRVVAGAICGSDLPHFRGQVPMPAAGGVGASLFDAHGEPPPGFPLHEVVGEVIASRAGSVDVGTRVVGWASRVDGLSEYVVARADGLYPLDRRWPAHIGVLLQPLACVLSAVERLQQAAAPRAAVIGQGPIGLLFSHVLKSRGARHVIGVDRVDRTGVAEAFGVDEVVHASSDKWSGGLLDADRPDLVIEAVGHQTATLDNAVRAAAPGGEIFYFGIPDDAWYPFAMNGFLRKNLTLRAGGAADRRASLAEASAYLLDHQELAEIYVTHTFPFARAQQAFELASRPAPGRLKVSLADDIQ
jgi:threonine dehydrogenase-like Zn-dependent dehydrogenase